VDDLLTTKQLQRLLQVDRITIYRMLNDGRLRGFKVGGQWRFSRREIEQWLFEQRADLDLMEAPLAAGADLMPSLQALPLSCIQTIQAVFAEALDIAAVTTDLDGIPLTDISNSCDFCNLILSTPEGHARCAASWKRGHSGQFQSCHAGLLCASLAIVVGGQRVAITAGCQFTTQLPEEIDHGWLSGLPTLAAGLGLDERELRDAAGSVQVMSQERLSHISRLLRRVVDTFSEIGQERLSLLSRLQHIAEISSI
jgi:excisionase family DNA binding protein